MSDTLLKHQAVRGVTRMIKTIKNLESHQGFPIDTVFATVSNPPTTAEISAAFDVPNNIGTDFVGFIIDSVNAYQFLVWTDGSNWYTVTQAGGSTDDLQIVLHAQVFS